MVGLRNKNLRRILLVFGISLLMACMSIFSLLPITKASSFDVWDGTSISTSLLGSGTEHDPYLIGSSADLAYFNSNVNQDKYYKLTANIDWNGNAWSPISIGYLDGGNHTIKGFVPSVLTIDNRQHFGLFTAIIGGISNLNIEYAEDFNINANSGLSFSLLATGQCALVDNVHITSTGSITINATNASEKTYVGGLVGSSVGDITNSSVSMNVVVNSNAIAYVGGLGGSVTGRSAGSGTNNSSTNVNLIVNSNANIYVGGLFGEFGTNSNCVIEDCYSRGSITASAPSGNGGKQYASGIAGKLDAGSTINRVYTTMDVCADSSYLAQGSEIKNSVIKSCQGHDYYQCNGHCQGHTYGACEGGTHYKCQNTEYHSSETVVTTATCQETIYRYQCTNCWHTISRVGNETIDFIPIDKHPAIFTADDKDVEFDKDGMCISTTAKRGAIHTEHVHGSGTVEELEAAGCQNYTTEQETIWTTVECPAYGVIVPYNSFCEVCGEEMAYAYEQEDCIDSSCPGWNENAGTSYHSSDNMGYCDNMITHSSGYAYSDLQGKYVAVEIDGCDNQELVTSGNCGSSHTYYVSYNPPRYESYTVNTGYVDIVDSRMTDNCVAFFNNESTLTSSNTLTAPTNYGRNLTQLQNVSTYSGWTDFDRYWIINSTLNDGLPVQRSTLSLSVNTTAILVDENNIEILPTDVQSWNEITTTGDGYYLSTDSGAELNETVTLGAGYDDGKYQFVGWARFDGVNYTVVSNSTPYNFEMTTANEGEWFALFREVNYDLTTSICVIKSDGTEITDENILKQYVELNITKNGSPFSTGKIKVLDTLKFTYEYLDINADFFAFDHWRVNGIQVTEDNINDILDNGEVNDTEHYLYTEVYNNVIANSKSNGTLDVVAVFRPVQYQVVVNNMNSSIGALAVDGVYDGDVETTVDGNLIIKNIDVYSTIPSVKATTENAITGWYYFNAELVQVEMFTFDQICKEMTSPTTDLRTEIVSNNARVVNHTLNFYVEFKTIYKVSVVTEVDFGTYTEYDKDCLAYVYQGGSAERLTEVYVYEGQKITFNYIEMSSWGYDFLGFFDKEIGASTATYTKRPATGEIVNETVVYGVYLRQSVDFSVKAYDQSAGLLYDFIDIDNTILDVSISASGSQFISQYERYNQGKDNEQWVFTLSEGKIQTIDSYTRYNDYLSVSLSLQNQMNKTYRILGIKLLNADAGTEQINNATYRVSDSGANRVSDTIRVNDIANRSLYLVYTRVDMSVQLASEIIGSGMTALDIPCENVLVYQDEVVSGNRVQDIVYGETIIFKSKAKVGFQFYGWKLPDGTIIQKSNISIDMDGNVSELDADPDYNILTLSAFDNPLKGIYTAVYFKIAYKFVVENVAGDNVFSIDGKSYTNGVDEIYINQTAGISANINPSKNYFGLSSQQNGSAEYYNTIQLTEALIALADNNNIIKLYQVYENNYLLTINFNNKTYATLELVIDGEIVEYSGARYVIKNKKVEINVTTADHYHFTISGVEDSCITGTGAIFNMTADTIISVNIEIDKHKFEFEVDEGYDGGAILTGDGEYSYGQIVHINASINSGFYFVKWTIDDGNGIQSKLVSEFDYTISSDTKCKIILKHRYTITTQVSNTFGASITPTFELNENDNAQIVVTLNPGYSLQGWQVDGASSDLVGTTINIIGEKTCTYTAVISQDKYYVNVEELTAVYGESGFTISAPQNGDYYAYNEQIDINLLTPLFMLRLNKLSANNVVLATNSSVSNESQLSVSLTAGDKTYFTGYTTTIHIDYTRIYALNIVKTKTEANDSVLNEIYYIKKFVSGDISTYHILDGTVVNIDTKDNAQYIFNKYELKVGADYETLSNTRETLYTVNSDCEIRVDYLGALYNIEFVNHILNEFGDEIPNFDQSWISSHTYSFKNSAGVETLEYRYGSEITISPATLPYGLIVHHFSFDGVDSISNSSITVVMNKVGNITVDVYYSRVAINVSVANSVGGAITQIQGNDIDAGNTIYSVTGEGTYYIGDKVTIKLGEIQAYKSYFINNGWSVNDNKLSFENRVAKFNGNTYTVENNSRTLIFTLVPFNNDTNLVLAPDLDYVEFSINVALYFNRTLYNATTENLLASATIIVNDIDTQSFSAKVNYKDKIEIAVTYNPNNDESYNNVYEFDEMTCNSYKIATNVAIDTNQNVIYTIAEFVSANKGNYRFK